MYVIMRTYMYLLIDYIKHEKNIIKGCSEYVFKNINDFCCTVLYRRSYHGVK